jgi:hypothetical protein
VVQRLAFATVLLLGMLIAVVLIESGSDKAPPLPTDPGEIRTDAAEVNPGQTLANGRAVTDEQERSAVVESPQPAVPSLAEVGHRLRVAVLVDERPAAGVAVEAFLADGKGILRDVRLAPLSTDVSGSVEFVFQEPRALRVRVRGSGGGIVTGDSWSQLNREAGETSLRLRLQRGAMLTGRVLDSEGQIASGWARFALASNEAELDTEAVHSAGAALDHEGRFAVAVPMSGPLVFRVSLDGAGRSLPGAAFVAPNSETDVGDVQLHGVGRIAGRLVLGDGTALGSAQVEVEAQLVGEPPEGALGLTWGTARPAAEGRFELAGLIPGEYELRVTEGLNDLRLLGSTRFPTGTTHSELTVDAWWLFVRARDAQGRVLAIELVDFGPDAASGGERAGSLRSTTVPRPGDVFEAVQATGGSLYFAATSRAPEGSGAAEKMPAPDSSASGSKTSFDGTQVANGEERRLYTGFFDGAIASGRHDLDLTLDARGLGSLRVHFVGDGVVQDARIHLSALTRGSGWLSMGRFPLEQGQPELLWHPLPPGRYALKAYITGVDMHEEPLLVAEQDLESEFEILSGATISVDLPLRRAGNYELQLVGVEGVDQARLKGRKSPDDPWEFLFLSQRYTKADGTLGMQVGSSFDPARPVRGPSPMLPGRYSILVECNGYEPVELTLDVLAGEITRREVPMTLAATR